MVVGIKEKHDIKFKVQAILILNGIKSEVFVYGDKRSPTRRDVFAPRTNTKLPKKARVRWLNKYYDVDLSFRRGVRGAIPVYSWKVKHKR